MKNKMFGFAVIAAIVLTALFALSTTACFGQSGGGKIVNNASALKEYLDSLPANSPDRPIKVTINANIPSFSDINRVIKSANKYVSLDLSGSPLTTIPYEAFAECTPLAGIIIPNSVTSIELRAFYDCASLTRVTIPNSVTSIGNHAFNQSGLANVTIGNSVTSIGEGAFAKCTGLTRVTIPNSVTSIGNYAFQDCTSLTSVTIGNSVTSIGVWAFDGCISLTAINVPANNSAYMSENGVLYNKNKTVLYTYPAGKKGAFTVPNSVTIIEDSAFVGCTSLTSVTIPNSVTSIDFRAFYGCASLTGITIPNSVTMIWMEAFRECKNLTSITIPNSVTSIGDGTFYECTSLANVTIPNSVTRIGNGAFLNCTSLTSVTFQSTIASNNFNNNSFDGDLKNKYLAGGIGTYTRPNGDSRTWTKQ